MPPTQPHSPSFSHKANILQSSLPIKHTFKKKVPSSDEQTNEEQTQSHREVSLKLFLGIRQLEEPVPQLEGLSREKSLGDRVEEIMSGLKDFRPLSSNYRGFSEAEVKQLLSNTIDSCSQILNSNITILTKRIADISQKLTTLHRHIQSLPLSIQQIKNTHNRNIFETNYLYEKDIEELNSRMVELEKQISSSKALSDHQSKQQFCSLRIVPESRVGEQQRGIKSLPEWGLTAMEERFEGEQEKSLLDGIDEELQQSGLKENTHKQSSLFPYVNFKDKPLTHFQLNEETVKKKSSHQTVGSNFKQVTQTTIKKDKVPPENDQILMSFAKNIETIIVQEDMLSEGTDESQRFQEDKRLASKRRESPMRKTNKINPQRSLKFGSPSLTRLQTLQYSPYEESQVQQFAIRQSPPIAGRMSTSKRRVPSLIEQSNITENMVLSREEKYLLQEIKHLRGIVEADEVEKLQVEWDELKNQLPLRKSSRKRINHHTDTMITQQLASCRDQLAHRQQRENKLLELLITTRKQLAQMKQNLHLLIPCQYCDFKDYLRQIFVQGKCSH